MTSITHFVGIDWTGAKGRRHPGLKVAVCEQGTGAPALVAPPSGLKNWSRAECSRWIADGLGLPKNARALVGIDAAFGYPFDAQVGYLRGDSNSKCAPDLWQEIGAECEAAEDLFGGPFIERHTRHYRHQQYNKVQGAFDTIVDNAFFQPVLREAEKICISEKYGPCESVFNLIGASQVGKSALSTMIMLNQLRREPAIGIWPFDEITGQSVVLVEIYAAVFSKLGGSKGKVRDIDDLNQTLEGLGSKPYCEPLPVGGTVDDVTDALMTAAGLRHIAYDRKHWHPRELSTMVRRTEGWIFGVI